MNWIDYKWYLLLFFLSGLTIAVTTIILNFLREDINMLLEYHLGSIYWFLEGSKRIVILENMPIPVGEWAEVLWGEKKEKFGYGKCDNN